MEIKQFAFKKYQNYDLNKYWKKVSRKESFNVKHLPVEPLLFVSISFIYG